MNQIIIFGSGETAVLAYEYFSKDSTYQVMGFAVDNEYLKGDFLLGLPLVAFSDVVSIFPPDRFSAFVAVGSTRMNQVRETLFDRVDKLKYNLVSYISSKAFVWDETRVGRNCLILENNTLQPFTIIEDNVILWSGNHIGHRSKIEKNCFISSQCVVSGFCNIGRNSFLGVNCTIEDGVKVGRNSFIGAGAMIRKNVIAGSVLQITDTKPSKVTSYKLFKVRKDDLE